MAAVIVYSSDIRAHVPLLVPWLCLYAAYSLYKSLQKCWPPRRTKIVSEFGEQLTIIPHLQQIATQREAFEQALLQAVRKARQKRYDEA